jgi:NhaP-type Na+/H+ or K+/H+ antiporter
MEGTALLAIIVIFSIPLALISIPILAIWLYHRRKMEEIKTQRQAAIQGNIEKEFASIRAEIQALRETTMQYDLSFDSALQRVERRLDALERIRMEPQNVTLGGRE